MRHKITKSDRAFKDFLAEVNLIQFEMQDTIDNRELRDFELINALIGKVHTLGKVVSKGLMSS